MGKSVVVASCIVIATSLAHAPLAGAQPGMPAGQAPVMTPPPGQTPVITPYEACLQQRHDISERASMTTDLRERTRLLQSMPTCTKPEPLAPPPPPTMSWNENPPPVTTMTTTTLEPIEGSSKLTAEVAGGLGVFFASGGPSTTRFGGLDLGIGGFLSPRAALTARLAGGTYIDSGIFEYAAVLQPHIQYWASDQVWIGGGIGLGFALYSASGTSGSSFGVGYDVRAGYSFAKRGNSPSLSVEITGYSPTDAYGSLTVLSLVLGYQMGPKYKSVVSTVPVSQPSSVRPAYYPQQRAVDNAAMLIKTAAEAARAGDCTQVHTLEPQIRDANPGLFNLVFRTDPDILKCYGPPLPTTTPPTPPTGPQTTIAPPTTTPPSGLPDSIDRAMVTTVVHGLDSAIKLCAKPGVTGRVKAKVAVEPTGVVTIVSILETPDAQVGDCVAAALKMATFPQTKLGGSFTYPFMF